MAGPNDIGWGIFLIVAAIAIFFLGRTSKAKILQWIGLALFILGMITLDIYFISRYLG